ncbi:MAG: hypothetical protein PHS59_09850 [Paludibacter sp.]|nr:hypothetical protein [Paludibacter sp.]
MRKYLISGIILLISMTFLNAQERVVKVDFESNSFKGSPSLPFDQHFSLEGDVYRDIDFVEVQIFNEGSDNIINRYTWNRDIRNESETFAIVVPGGLKSNTKYDFKVLAYKMMTQGQKESLLKNLESRIHYFLYNNYQFDGSKVTINNPKKVYDELKLLLKNSLSYQLSKNNIKNNAPSLLVLDELKRHSEFKFRNFLSKKKIVEKDSIANKLIEDRVNSMTALILSELQPYFNSQLVQFNRCAYVKSVSTDKEQFSIPVNFGMYAWNKNVSLNNVVVQNTNFTPGVGISIPFTNKLSIDSKFKIFDSFGFSLGVLLSPVRDANGTQYVTPGINLPVYTGLGIRLFNVIRLNAGVLVVGEKGLQDFNSLYVLPTAGLALELNLWMGIKK